MQQDQQLTIQQACELALTFFNTGRYAESESLCRTLLESTPDNHAALFVLGCNMQVNGRLAESISLLKKAVLLTQQSWNYRYFLAFCLWQDRQLKEAEEVLSSALAAPGFAPEDRASGFELLGRVLFEEGKHDEAIAAYQQGFAIVPSNALMGTNLALAYKNKGYYKDAVLQAKKVLAFSPPTASLLSVLSDSLGELERYEEALTFTLKWNELYPGDWASYYTLGMLFTKLGRLDGAETALQDSIRLNPDSPTAHEQLGGVQVRLGNYDAAAAEYKAAIGFEKDPAGLAGLYDGLAQAYSGARHYAEAAQMFDRAFELQVQFTKLENISATL